LITLIPNSGLLVILKKFKITICHSLARSFVLFRGGQFAPARGGQFGPTQGGQFVASLGGQFEATRAVFFSVFSTDRTDNAKLTARKYEK